jgi:hypothetical protein
VSGTEVETSTGQRPEQWLATVLGLLDGAKKSSNAALTALHRQSKSRDRFDGFSRVYLPDAASDGEEPKGKPSETKLVELTAEQQLLDVAGALERRLDLQLTVDTADTTAFADIRVPDGRGGETVLVQRVPVTTLMVLYKVLEDVRTFLRNLPVQDPSREWHPDTNADGVYATPPVQTISTEKTPKVITKVPATDKHPAQTEVYWPDSRVGVWEKIDRTGALPPKRYGELLQRVEALLDAVKTAREEANRVKAPDRQLGGALFRYLNTGQ